MKIKKAVFWFLILIFVFVVVIIFPAGKNEDIVNRNELLLNPLYTEEKIEYYGMIDGYHFYKYYGPICENIVLEQVVVSGFNFGYSLGCSATLDYIGFIVLKDGNVSGLQELVDDGSLHVWKLYFKIYIWNKQN